MINNKAVEFFLDGRITFKEALELDPSIKKFKDKLKDSFKSNMKVRIGIPLDEDKGIWFDMFSNEMVELNSFNEETQEWSLKNGFKNMSISWAYLLHIHEI